MVISYEALIIGNATTTLLSVGALFFVKNQFMRLFFKCVSLLAVLDMIIGVFLVGFDQVKTQSFQGLMILIFNLPWNMFHMPGMLILGVDEIVERHGEIVAYIGYTFSIIFWAFLVTWILYSYNLEKSRKVG